MEVAAATVLYRIEDIVEVGPVPELQMVHVLLVVELDGEVVGLEERLVVPEIGVQEQFTVDGPMAVTQIGEIPLVRKEIGRRLLRIEFRILRLG